MKRVLATALILAITALSVACNGGGSTRPTGTATSTTNFEQLRDALRNRLNGIGVNIGVVPDDVLNQILNQCHELEQFTDQTRVNDLCTAVRRARDTNDVGLLDQIVTQIGQLKQK